ncbi:MAG: ABC transporter ATPase [Sphingobacteriaceae bacterium]
MQISENSRIWIYQADRVLQQAEEAAIQQQLNAFTANWEAHGNELSAIGEIRHQRFIILALDEEKAGATGCSIDKSVALMKTLEQQFNISLFDRMQIAYRQGHEIKTCSKDEFTTLMEAGQLTNETIVFNNLIPTYSELETNWEIPLKQSWHAKVFA